MPPRLPTIGGVAFDDVDEIEYADAPMVAPDGSYVEFGEPQDMDVYELSPTGEMLPVMPEDDLMPVVDSAQHDANLAEVVDEGELQRIATTLLEAIEDDLASQEPWTERFRRGMELMGLIDDEIDDGPFPGASTAVMPIISEAVAQFWARSMGEQVPSTGPVKATVLGRKSEPQLERADRVAAYMNYDIMSVDKGWYHNHSRMLFALPYSGSCYKKVYRDFDTGQNCSIFVAAEDFIVNYAFSDLETAPRYTHRVWRSKNEIRKMQWAGVYRDVELQAALSNNEDLPEATQMRHEIDGFDVDNDGDDARHELYECYVELDLLGFEDVDPRTSQLTGIALPYIVTIDVNSEKILSIYRGWREMDPLKRRRTCFVKYDYLPGPGFHGLGLLHMIGGLQEAATGALRAIIDGAAMSSLQGGFVTKDASLRDQELTIEPGVWKQVDATLDDLSKAFFTPPLREPSGVLYSIMGTLTERAEKFTATTELMTGQQDSKNAPVGSTLALIEQGSRVFSTIHRGLHKSLSEELRMRYELIQEYMPAEGYPYDVEGGHEGILAQDFAPGVSVMPVSDPNIFSSAQRIAQAQEVMGLANMAPDLLKRDVAVKRYLQAIKVPDYEELLVENEPPPPMDPITEIQALLRGEPVQAYPDQDQMAHIQHYMAFMQNPQFGGNPEVMAAIGPQGQALIGQRLAYLWASHARAMGAPVELLPPPMMGPDQQGGPQPGMMQPPVAPEQIAQIAAQIAPGMTNVPGLPNPQQDAEQARINMDQAKLQMQQEKHQQDMQISAAKADLEMQSKTAKTQQDLAKTARQEQQERQDQVSYSIERQAKLDQDLTLAQSKMMQEQLKAEVKLQVEAMKAELKAEEARLKQQAEMIATTQKARAAEAETQIQVAKAAQDMEIQREQAAVDAAVKVAKAKSDNSKKAKDQDRNNRNSRTKRKS